MTSNASACYLKILIGSDNQDWSGALKSFDVGMPMRDRGGLLPLNGKLTLTYWYNAPESMNPRVNSARWFRGQIVKVQVSFDGTTYTTHPCGWLYILKEPSVASPDAPDLVLDVGCQLALNNYVEPDNDKAGVVLGTATTRTTAIASILTAARVTNWVGSVPAYPIAHPLPKIGGSYVQQAGKVAFAGFKALWQDNTGYVQAADLNINPSASTTVNITIGVGGGEIVYKPSEGSETPVEELRCVGVDRVGIDTWRCLDGNADEGYEVTSTSTRVIRRKIITDCQGLDGGGLFYKTRQEYVEEIAANVYPIEEPGSYRLTWSYTKLTRYIYEPGITGKLILTEEQTTRPFAAAMSAWWGNLTDAERGVYTRSASVIASLITTTYNYQDYPTPQDGSAADQWALDYQSQIVAGQTTLTRLPLPAIAPNEDLSAISPVQSLFPSSVVTEIWKKVRGYEWQKSTLTQQPLITAKTELAALTSSIFNKVALVTSDDQTDVSAAGGQQPPAPERRPDRYTEIDIQIKGRALFGTPAGSNAQKRFRSIEVEYMVSNDQAEAIARSEGALLIGRRQGQTILVPFSPALASAAPPLQVWRCTEPDGTTYIYQADAIQYTHDPERAVVGCTGIWLGTIPAGGSTPALPYSAIVPLSGGIRIGGSPVTYPYAIGTTAATTIDGGGIRIGGSPTTLSIGVGDINEAIASDWGVEEYAGDPNELEAFL